MIRVGLDTNVLAYAAGVDRDPTGAAKLGAARELLSPLAARVTLVAPMQVLTDFYVVLTRVGEMREGARETMV